MILNKIKKDERGVILVLTLIILSVFLSIALSFSYFVIIDIKQARVIDDSVIAYYSADSGLEKSLYLLMKQKAFTSVSGLKGAFPTSQTLTESNGLWDIGESKDSERTFFRQRLTNGQNVKFYILKRSEQDGKPKSILINWKKGRVPSGGSEVPAIVKLQVSLTQLTAQDGPDGAMIYYTDTNKIEELDSLENGESACYNLKDEKIDGIGTIPAGDYAVELRALGASDIDFIDQISATAYDTDCNTIDENQIPNSSGLSNMTIKSKGRFGAASQSIMAHLLPRDPASGLLGFVLFSEQEVLKDGANN